MATVFSWKITSSKYAYITKYPIGTGSYVADRITDNVTLTAMADTIKGWTITQYTTAFNAMKARVSVLYPGYQIAGTAADYYNKGISSNYILLSGRDGVSGGTWEANISAQGYREINAMISSAMTNVENRMDTLQSEVGTQISQAVTTQIAETKNEIAATSAQMMTISSSLATEATNRENAINTLRQEITDGTISTGAAIVVMNTVANDWFEENGATVVSQYISADASMQQIGTIQTAVNALEGQMSTLGVNVNTVSGTVGTVQSDLNASIGLINDIATWYNESASTITEAARTINSCAGTITDVIQHADEINGRVTNVESRMDGINATIANSVQSITQTAITSITSQMDAIKAETATSMASFNILSQQVNSYDERVSVAEGKASTALTMAQKASGTAISVRDEWSAASGKLSTVSQMVADMDSGGTLIRYATREGEDVIVTCFLDSDGVYKYIDDEGNVYYENETHFNYSVAMSSFVNQTASGVSMGVFSGNSKAMFTMYLENNQTTDETKSVAALIADQIILDADTTLVRHLISSAGTIGGINLEKGTIAYNGENGRYYFNEFGEGYVGTSENNGIYFNKHIKDEIVTKTAGDILNEGIANSTNPLIISASEVGAINNDIISISGEDNDLYESFVNLYNNEDFTSIPFITCIYDDNTEQQWCFEKYTNTEIGDWGISISSGNDAYVVINSMGSDVDFHHALTSITQNWSNTGIKELKFHFDSILFSNGSLLRDRINYTFKERKSYSLYSNNFAIKSNGDAVFKGVISATSGYFSGRVDATEGNIGNLKMEDGMLCGGFDDNGENPSIIINGKKKESIMFDETEFSALEIGQSELKSNRFGYLNSDSGAWNYFVNNLRPLSGQSSVLEAISISGDSCLHSTDSLFSGTVLDTANLDGAYIYVDASKVDNAQFGDTDVTNCAYIKIKNKANDVLLSDSDRVKSVTYVKVSGSTAIHSKLFVEYNESGNDSGRQFYLLQINDSSKTWSLSTFATSISSNGHIIAQTIDSDINSNTIASKSIQSDAINCDNINGTFNGTLEGTVNGTFNGDANCKMLSITESGGEFYINKDGDNVLTSGPNLAVNSSMSKQASSQMNKIEVSRTNSNGHNDGQWYESTVSMGAIYIGFTGGELTIPPIDYSLKMHTADGKTCTISDVSWRIYSGYTSSFNSTGTAIKSGVIWGSQNGYFDKTFTGHTSTQEMTVNKTGYYFFTVHYKIRLSTYSFLGSDKSSFTLKVTPTDYTLKCTLAGQSADKGTFIGYNGVKITAPYLTGKNAELSIVWGNQTAKIIAEIGDYGIIIGDGQVQMKLGNMTSNIYKSISADTNGNLCLK